MNSGNGLVTKIFSWGSSPTYSDTTALQWGAGLVLVLMASFLWSNVIRQVVD